MKHLFIFLLMMATTITFISCHKPENNADEQVAVAEKDVQLVPVEIYHVQRGEIADIVSATGMVRPFLEAYVASEASGRITQMDFEVGDRVSAGDLLVQLDDELARLAVDQAEAQRLQAEATYEKAGKDLERSEKLYSDGSISEFELETARVKNDVGKSNYLLADAGLKTARRQRADTRITSPIGGIIAERSVDVGETVAPGTPVAKIVDIDRLRVQIGLSTEQIVKVQSGQKVTLSIDAYPGLPFEGSVFTVGPEAHPDTRTFPVEIDVRNSADYPLKSGMVAKVDLAVDVLRNVPLIPRDAIIERSGKYIAFVIEDEKAGKRKLELGAQSGDMVEVRGGIRAGEDVVVVGQENLSDGTRVSVQ